MVLDSFIKRSVTGGLGSGQAEIMADTAVALASANVALVARKVIGRLCRVGPHSFTMKKILREKAWMFSFVFMDILVQGQIPLIKLVYLIDWVNGVSKLAFNTALISYSSIQEV